MQSAMLVPMGPAALVDWPDATGKVGCKWQELVSVQTWVTICHSCRRSPWLGEVRTPLLTAPMGGPSPAGAAKGYARQEVGPSQRGELQAGRCPDAWQVLRCMER